MMTPPLQLKSYIIPNIVIKADPQYSRETEYREPIVAHEISVFRDDREALEYNLDLGIKIKNDPNHQVPYELDINVFGFFSIDQKLSPEQRLEVATVNGASILYGAARDLVVTLTGRGPWPAIILPAISFVKTSAHVFDLKAIQAATNESAVKQQSKRKKKSKK